MYKHILIATDGSEPAQKAETMGLTLAKALNAHVTAITVFAARAACRPASAQDSGRS
jgi:nucleotide-binding universal stress UspA family protein